MIKRTVSLLLAAALFFLLFPGCGQEKAAGEEKEGTGMAARESKEFLLSAFTYPEEVLYPLPASDGGKALSELLRRTVKSGYGGMKHQEGTSLVHSPYFSLTAEGVEVPVYAAPVYIATGNRGALHSFASVDLAFGKEKEAVFILTGLSGTDLSEPHLFSSDEKARVELKDGAAEITLTGFGTYTLLFHDDQESAFTLFVRPYADEEEEIARLRETRGEDKVRVFEPGLHEITYELWDEDDVVFYLKSGAVLLPKHTFDMDSDEDIAGKREERDPEYEASGVTRFPVMAAFQKKGLRLLGRGTIDMTGMDWHERCGPTFAACEDILVEDLIVVNAAEWSLIVSDCRDAVIRRCAVFGFRTNSDAFAVASSEQVTVTDSFARTGDDMFQVKNTGGRETKNVLFTRCQAWGSKARCYGVTGEVMGDISDVTFEKSFVIWRDAIWDNDRIGSLVVIRETGTGKIENILFRDIEVWYDAGRAVNCVVYSPEIAGSEALGVVFENVTYRAKMESQCMINAGEGNRMDVLFKNVTANGERITPENLAKKVLSDAPGLCRAE